ncbi:MAG TPA: VIT family protein [Gemmatimonadaceae bacterium]|nr:VIT family protein [Gemmatimonadaceae bacterium]
MRAGVLGANDGIVSTAALVVGVAAAASGRSAILIAGLAGLVAGAMSMAAGEYVSVSSQADTEKADIARERKELAQQPDLELKELQQIYIDRGLDADLALRVAEQLTSRDALAAHARDELGITEAQSAKPVQAALASAATFSVGAALPLIIAVLVPDRFIIGLVSAGSLICLAVLGAIAAGTGGADRWRGALRVTIWSALALAATALVGRAFNTSVL